MIFSNIDFKYSSTVVASFACPHGCGHECWVSATAETECEAVASLDGRSHRCQECGKEWLIAADPQPGAVVDPLVAVRIPKHRNTETPASAL